MITENYKQQNAELHRTAVEYGSGGGRWAPVVMNMCMENKTQDVLDYGCGKASLHMQLPFGIQNFDPAIPKYAQLPAPADIIVCTDVMEHIEPEFTDAVLDDLKRLMLKEGLINIACKEAQRILPDGRNAHLVTEDGRWWYEKFQERFKIKSVQMDESAVTLAVLPL